MRKPTATAIETTVTIAMMAARRTVSLLSSAFRIVFPVHPLSRAVEERLAI
jgi:hypothetical protein